MGGKQIKMNKRNFNFVLAGLILIVLFSNISALGITPGRTTIDFSSGLEKTVEFSVVNSDAKDVSLVVLIQGELNQSVSVSEVAFSMSASEAEKQLSYKIKLPTNLEPGVHTAEVVVIQLPEKSSGSEAFFGAAMGVATQIHVNVPYPGKYAEAALNVIGPDQDGTIHFAIPVISRGNLDLVKVKAVIDIYSALNEKVETFTTQEVGVLSGERKELAVKWNPTVLPGKYRAVATLIYDEQTKTLEKEFNVGQRTLSIESIEVNDFRLGEIAKFEILVENKWGEPIRSAFAEMFVYDNQGKVMAEIKSPNYDVNPLEKALMIAFWDTGGVRVGTYNSELFLRFGQESAQHELKLEVSERNINVVGVGYVIFDSGEGGDMENIVVILITVVVILILLNVVWFVALRKKIMPKLKGK